MDGNILANYYDPLLQQNNFQPIACPEKFSPSGSCWELSPSIGKGYYRIYGKRDLFDIKIHDFYFHKDFCLDVEIPEGINIQRYNSISGKVLNPYRCLSSGDIETIVGGKQRYRALIHKRIPIHSVGIEILPAYYEEFLKKQYPDEYFDLPAAFQSIDQAADLLLPLIYPLIRDGRLKSRFLQKQMEKRMAQMGEKYRARYERHFAHPIIHEQDLRHEELLACYPEQWAALVREVIG